jgi:toxin-antitoxin system PIN domain toxin
VEFLPEINVWLALTFSGHGHHPEAARWFHETAQPKSCLFCRMTQQGYLRLATNPKVFLRDALTLTRAWNAYDTLRRDPRAYFADEPSQVEQTWRKLTNDESFSPKIWNDAFLAAFAMERDCQLVTFDRGFRRYSGLNLVLLEP